MGKKHNDKVFEDEFKNSDKRDAGKEIEYNKYGQRLYKQHVTLNPKTLVKPRFYIIPTI